MGQLAQLYEKLERYRALDPRSTEASIARCENRLLRRLADVSRDREAIQRAFEEAQAAALQDSLRIAYQRELRR